MTKDDGSRCNLLNDGVFHRQNKLICDDRLVASFKTGLVHVKSKGNGKYSFRFAARQHFWFEEGSDDIHQFVLRVHHRSSMNYNCIHLAQHSRGDGSLTVMEIAKLAKYEIAKNDKSTVSSFLDELQKIGERDPPSMYDKSLLFALCRKEETPSPVGKVLPCRIRADYKDDISKSWTYTSPLCLCDISIET